MMRNLLAKALILPSMLTTPLLFQGCSSHEVLYESEAHLYDNNFGVLQSYNDPNQQEVAVTYSEPIYTADRSSFHTADPTLTTEMVHDPDAFTLEEYVQPEPVVTYKYMHSSKFFTEEELPQNKLLTAEELYRH